MLLYFVCEVLGILASFLLWLLEGPYVSRDVERYLRKNFVLQCWWARTLVGGAFKLFSIQLEMEGIQEFRGRPILVFVRHACTDDAVLPAMLIGIPQKIMLRYIMKRELRRGFLCAHRPRIHHIHRAALEGWAGGVPGAGQILGGAF